ncbi:hypothetical protein [Aurantibacter aestuarii]|uniref:Uncharacterized protein n=1 Tax=Aurantibacter aestuarii TaxID=1266046 RepID=A0A2T1NEL0_9FLAO|nr:hypothetical protein [Aurantibacter aestuarii]PSG90877.1 hypothetical protein C7H52_06280 [Aurantibacter aestuarii]
MKKIDKQKLKETAKKTGDKAVNLLSNPNTYKVAGALLLVYLGYKVVNKVADKVAGEEIDDEVNGTGGSTNGATISQQQANNYAQQLLDAFNSKEPLYGTDEEAVLNVFKKLVNTADFIRVYNAFGTKDYNGNNSPPTGAWSWFDSYEKRNLVYWLKSELSPSDGEVYQVVKAIVNQSGFSF